MPSILCPRPLLSSSLLTTLRFLSFFFFFNDTATTEIYTLSLHDALPISSTSSSPTRRTGSSGSARARSRASPPRTTGTSGWTSSRSSTSSAWRGRSASRGSVWRRRRTSPPRSVGRLPAAARTWSTSASTPRSNEVARRGRSTRPLTGGLNEEALHEAVRARPMAVHQLLRSQLGTPDDAAHVRGRAGRREPSRLSQDRGRRRRRPGRVPEPAGEDSRTGPCLPTPAPGRQPDRGADRLPQPLRPGRLRAGGGRRRDGAALHG